MQKPLENIKKARLTLKKIKDKKVFYKKELAFILKSFWKKVWLLSKKTKSKRLSLRLQLLLKNKKKIKNKVLSHFVSILKKKNQSIKKLTSQLKTKKEQVKKLNILIKRTYTAIGENKKELQKRKAFLITLSSLKQYLVTYTPSFYNAIMTYSINSLPLSDFNAFLMLPQRRQALLRLISMYKKSNKKNFTQFLGVILQNLQEFQISNRKRIQVICKVKRKYLKVCGFFRRFLNNKLEFLYKTPTTSKIQIEYKKINLVLKYRPKPLYFLEMNYNTLSFTLVNDFDFLNYPYKTLFDFNTISHFFSR